MHLGKCIVYVIINIGNFLWVKHFYIYVLCTQGSLSILLYRIVKYFFTRALLYKIPLFYYMAVSKLHHNVYPTA